jgi:hypothetical protein
MAAIANPESAAHLPSQKTQSCEIGAAEKTARTVFLHARLSRNTLSA